MDHATVFFCELSQRKIYKILFAILNLEILVIFSSLVE